MKTTFLNILSILFIATIGCKEYPTNTSNIETKEYIWTEEQIGSGVVPTAIWGIAPNNLWAIGWNQSWNGEIYHYNGKLWSCATPHLESNTIFSDIYGFGEHDIYIAGYIWRRQTDSFMINPLILHYNGNQWSTAFEDTSLQGYFNKIHGNSPNNIWAVGGGSIIYHYDGLYWEKQPSPDTLDFHSVISLSNNRTYLTYEYNDHKEIKIIQFGEYLNDNIKTYDSCRITIKFGEMVGYKFGYKNFCYANDELYSVAPGVTRLNGKKWILETWDDYWFNDLKSYHNDEVYAVGNHGIISHKKNSNWTRIGKYANQTIDFKAVIPFENELFILGQYQNNFWIIKRTLKDN